MAQVQLQTSLPWIEANLSAVFGENEPLLVQGPPISVILYSVKVLAISSAKESGIRCRVVLHLTPGLIDPFAEHDKVQIDLLLGGAGNGFLFRVDYNQTWINLSTGVGSVTLTLAELALAALQSSEGPFKTVPPPANFVNGVLPNDKAQLLLLGQMLVALITSIVQPDAAALVDAAYMTYATAKCYSKTPDGTVIAVPLFTPQTDNVNPALASLLHSVKNALVPQLKYLSALHSSPKLAKQLTSSFSSFSLSDALAEVAAGLPTEYVPGKPVAVRLGARLEIKSVVVNGKSPGGGALSVSASLLPEVVVPPAFVAKRAELQDLLNQQIVATTMSSLLFAVTMSKSKYNAWLAAESKKVALLQDELKQMDDAVNVIAPYRAQLLGKLFAAVEVAPLTPADMPSAGGHVQIRLSTTALMGLLNVAVGGIEVQVPTPIQAILGSETSHIGLGTITLLTTAGAQGILLSVPIIRVEGERFLSTPFKTGGQLATIKLTVGVSEGELSISLNEFQFAPDLNWVVGNTDQDFEMFANAIMSALEGVTLVKGNKLSGMATKIIGIIGEAQEERGLGNTGWWVLDAALKVKNLVEMAVDAVTVLTSSTPNLNDEAKKIVADIEKQLTIKSDLVAKEIERLMAIGQKFGNPPLYVYPKATVTGMMLDSQGLTITLAASASAKMAIRPPPPPRVTIIPGEAVASVEVKSKVPDLTDSGVGVVQAFRASIHPGTLDFSGMPQALFGSAMASLDSAKYSYKIQVYNSLSAYEVKESDKVIDVGVLPGNPPELKFAPGPEAYDLLNALQYHVAPRGAVIAPLDPRAAQNAYDWLLKQAAVLTYPPVSDGSMFGAIVSAPVVMGWSWEVGLWTTLVLLADRLPNALVAWANRVLDPATGLSIPQTGTLTAAEIEVAATIAGVHERLVGLGVLTASLPKFDSQRLEAIALDATGWGSALAAAKASPDLPLGGSGVTVSLGGVVLVEAHTGKGLTAFQRMVWKKWEVDPSSPVIGLLPHLAGLSPQRVMDARTTVKLVLKAATEARRQ